MVEIIGLVTIGGLVWLLAWSLAGESDAERRKLISIARDSRLGQTAKSFPHIRKAA
jgi:hypothetical protein